MTLTVEVPPDVEASLQAQAQGLDIPHYVESVLRREAMAQPVAEVFRPAAELTFEERREHLRKFLESHAGNTVVLTDERWIANPSTRTAAYRWTLRSSIAISCCACRNRHILNIQ